MRGLGPILLLLLATGCTVVPERAGHVAGDCGELFSRLDRAVVEAGAVDGGSFPIAGFPHLRADRFLASFAEEVHTPERAEAWVGRLRQLDREARRAELANLDPERRAALPTTAEVEACGERLVAADLTQSQRLAALREAIDVPDEYREWQRLLGVYPISRWFVLRGVLAWHEQARERFGYGPPGFGRRQLLVPAAAPSASPPMAALRRDALGVPQLDERELEALLAAYAPIWELEQGGDFDRPGRPLPDGPGFRAEPIVFGKLSFTRFQGEVLIQLSYWIWFSERPPDGAFDILAGRLDSVILRVTLDADGQPLLYDSVHGCGCWHQFFPGPRLAAREPPAGVEPPLVYGAAPAPGVGEQLVVALSSGAHELRGLYLSRAEPAQATGYEIRPYAELLSQPAAQGRRSLFAASGIAPGTERAERYLLWPTGVPEPGATRQWGRHATAFIGERHFDDPHLLQRLFRRSDGAERSAATP